MCVQCVGVSQSQGVADRVLKISHVVAIKMPESDSGTDWLTHWRGQHLPSNFTCCFFNGNPNYSEANSPPFYLSLPPVSWSIPCSMCCFFVFFGGEMKNFALKLIEGSPALTPRNVVAAPLSPPSTMLIPFWCAIFNERSLLLFSLFMIIVIVCSSLSRLGAAWQPKTPKRNKPKRKKQQ